MHINEAMMLLAAGKKIAHRYFADNEYLQRDAGGVLRFQNGTEVNETEYWANRRADFWLNGWSEYQPAVTIHPSGFYWVQLTDRITGGVSYTVGWYDVDANTWKLPGSRTDFTIDPAFVNWREPIKKPQ